MYMSLSFCSDRVFFRHLANVARVAVGKVFARHEDFVDNAQAIVLVYLMVHIGFGDEFLARLYVERELFQDFRPIDRGGVTLVTVFIVQVPKR